MNYVRIKTDHIKSIFKLLKVENRSLCVFKNGTVSTEYKSGIIISVKSPLAFFDGALWGASLRCIVDLQKEDLNLRTSNYRLKIKSGTSKTDIFFFQSSVHSGISFDPWDPSIKWHPCSPDIVHGICHVADALPPSSNSALDPENLVHSAIHVVENYVIAIDFIFRRASRYRLSGPSAFNFSLSPSGLKQTFGRLTKRKLHRIGQAENPGNKGVAFDFGDVRIWVPILEVNENNNHLGDIYDRSGNAILFGRDSFIASLHYILNMPSKFIIVIPKNWRDHFPTQGKATNANNYPMILTFTKRKVHCLCETENLSAKGFIPISNTIPRYPFKVKVNALHFAKALTGGGLMGLIDLKKSEGQCLLYFKDKRLEHLIRAEKN